MSSFDDAMNLWVQAGGSPQSAAMAAAVADASSGLDPNATYTDGEGIVHKGLWGIPSTLGALSTLDPLANARAAIQLSNNGTDFSKWCSAWSDNDCGNSGGTYLGDGSNAVAALGARGGAYDVIGGVGVTSAVPTGVNPATYGDTSGDSTDSSSDTTDTSSMPASEQDAASATKTGPNLLIYAVVIVVLIGVLWFINRRKSKPAE